MIQAYFFGVGAISTQRNDYIQYHVDSLKNLAVVIAHFDKYILLSQKRADYELFKRVVDMMSRQEHLTLEGLTKVVSLRGAMNTGLSEKQKAAFSAAVLVQRPLVEDQDIKNPYWLAGFSSGEGSFFVQISKSLTKVGFRVKLRFSISQHFRDTELLTSFKNYLGCGEVYKISENAVAFVVTRFSDIHDKLIPFFSKYPIQGVKALDFDDFCKVVNFMKTKTHLTPKGLGEIRKLKAGMNTRRKMSTWVRPQFNLETKTKTLYSSMREAALALNVPYSSITSYCSRSVRRNTNPYKGRYQIKKLSN